MSRVIIDRCDRLLTMQGAEEAVTGDYVTFDAPLDHIPLHVRGGYIVVTQEPANTTVIR